jgi:hypothetical protein
MDLSKTEDVRVTKQHCDTITVGKRATEVVF